MSIGALKVVACGFALTLEQGTDCLESPVAYALSIKEVSFVGHYECDRIHNDLHSADSC
ncbi:MAG: hypothetical protein AAGM27_02620 [Cyanobacteria bacterium J06554_3]